MVAARRKHSAAAKCAVTASDNAARKPAADAIRHASAAAAPEPGSGSPLGQATP